MKKHNLFPNNRRLFIIVFTIMSLLFYLLLIQNSLAQKNGIKIHQSYTNTTIKKRLYDINNLAKQADGGQVKSTSAMISEELSLYLQDSSLEVRLRAIDALAGIGIQGEKELPVKSLIRILEDQNQPVGLRRHAILAIRSISAKEAVEPLIRALDDPDPIIRSKAAGALGSIRQKASKAIPKLILLVKSDPYSEIRASSAAVLSKIDPANEEVWLTLNEALEDPSWRVRRNAADAFTETVEGAKIAVPNLIKALNNQNFTLRSSAANTLGILGPEAHEAISDLRRALKNNNNPFAQGQAAKALGNIGADDTDSIEALINALNNRDPYVRNQAYHSFHKIIYSMENTLLEKNEISTDSIQQIIEFLREAIAQIQLPNTGFSEEQINDLHFILNRLKAKQAEKAFVNIIIKNYWFWGGVIYFVFHLGLFWLRPLWLLKLDEVLKPLTLKISILGLEISPRMLLFLKFRSRVLDAWVDAQIESVQEEFQKIENVAARKVYIPCPATLDNRTVSEITNLNLGAKFNKPLLIWGEGGVGKTSLACQIAQWAMANNKSERLCKHRMLPIFLEEELDCHGESCKQSLIDAILGQLKILANEEEPISEELLERLLRRRRILVIVDHLSEMNEQTQKTIDPERPDFPINALIVTSRQKESLGQVNKLIIKPLRIMGNRLSSFMEAYLVQEGKRDLFTDSEFFDACSRLSQMVGQREVTAMLATLYGKQLINAKVETSQDISALVSDNIPDLMLNYLNQLNRDLIDSSSEQDKFDDRTVHKDAMKIAWACIQETYRPSSIKREKALATLAEFWADKAEDHLTYLEERLFLVQTIGASKDHLRFSLDPLAEYLAGLHLINLYNEDENKWLDFLSHIEITIENLDQVSGFMRALQDCCYSKGKEAKISSLVLNKINLMQSKEIYDNKVKITVLST